MRLYKNSNGVWAGTQADAPGFPGSAFANNAKEMLKKGLTDDRTTTSDG